MTFWDNLLSNASELPIYTQQLIREHVFHLKEFFGEYGAQTDKETWLSQIKEVIDYRLFDYQRLTGSYDPITNVWIYIHQEFERIKNELNR